MGPKQEKLDIDKFERALLCGDAKTLANHGYHDAACVATGDFDIFRLDREPLYEYKEPVTLRSVEIATQCIEICSTEVTLCSSKLGTALADAGSGDCDALYACYVAGVALLQAFVRENWAGPVAIGDETEEHEAAGFFLSVDGEDVARPARRLPWLRAARYILVDSVAEFVRNGATLAPWWAARALLAHQAILSHATSTLQYELFTMYGRFLGKENAETRYLFDAKPPKATTMAEDESDDDLLPAPVADGDDDMHDEEGDFGNRFNEDDAADRELMTLAFLELSLAQKMFYDSDGAYQSLWRACHLAGVGFRISGEMGVRTKYQQKPTAQMIGRAFRIEDPSYREHPCDSDTNLKLVFPSECENRTQTTPEHGEKGEADCMMPQKMLLPTNVPLDDSDALGYVKLSDMEKTVQSTVSDENEDELEELPRMDLGAEREDLTPIHQAISLCSASVVRARNASHILTKEEMAPYVELVLRNAKSSFGTSSVTQIRALLMRVSFERNRGRYLERCMSQMEEIGKFIDNKMDSANAPLRAAAAAERNMFIFATALPPRWDLKKELAISFGKIGLVKSAMQIFESLEFWDELVDCHRLIGNLGAAEALVRDQLEKLDAAVVEDGDLAGTEALQPSFNFGASRAVQARSARRPRLLCVLGDVTRNGEHFETAWEESGHRYARAKRALARMCVESEEWKEAVLHFREALQVNSLFPETWFTYGCAAIQINDMQTAAHAFTRVVQQTPENGEAWNNLGRVLHELGKKKASLQALMEAGKRKRDSWRIWNNALLLAVELRSSLNMVRAMERLLDLRGKDGIESDAVGAAVAEVIRMSDSEDVEDKVLVPSVTKRLLKILGRCSALVSTNPSIWAAYAELHELIPSSGGKQKAFDCRLRQVRALLAHGDWKRELRVFRHMIIATEALVRDASLSENNLNVRAAGLHVKSVVEQTREDFKEDQGFYRLMELERSTSEFSDVTDNEQTTKAGTST